MKLNRISAALIGLILFSSLFFRVSAQEEVSWLSDFTKEMTIGKEIYQYKFRNVEGNDCKMEILELLTNKKGELESQSWIFYLSDINPSAIRYSSKGKYIEINLATRNSQKFISAFEEDEFDEYTDEINLRMNEVDLSRRFIELFRDNSTECKQTETSWASEAEAIAFLSEKIGEAQDDDILRKQTFSSADKPNLVTLLLESEDEDGEKESAEYLFDLNDINPLDIKLKPSGRTLSIIVPVRGGDDFIEVQDGETRNYTDELTIYDNDIESARQIVNALSYIVTNAKFNTKEWSSYSDAMNFVKNNLVELKIDDNTYAHSLEFEDYPSGKIDLTIEETDEDGEKEIKTYSFYLADMAEKALMKVSKDRVSVIMETKNDRDFIMESEAEIISGYESDLSFYVPHIDIAREIITALNYAIDNSEEEIEEFSSVKDVNDWLEDNLVELFRDDEKYTQKMSVSEDENHQITLEQIFTDEDEEKHTKFILYPTDIDKEELNIKVSGGKLNVPLQTDKDDFIKSFENEQPDDFTDDTKVFFSDPLVAKNFIAAVNYLKENSAQSFADEMSRDEALEFIVANIQNLEFDDESFEQGFETMEDDPCKCRFTRVETDDDGEKEEFAFEFIASDIHEGNSDISVSGKYLEIELVTSGKDKLIKPYENGEVEDFKSEFSIYCDDVILARKILKAFSYLSEGCK